MPEQISGRMMGSIPETELTDVYTNVQKARMSKLAMETMLSSEYQYKFVVEGLQSIDRLVGQVSYRFVVRLCGYSSKIISF